MKAAPESDELVLRRIEDQVATVLLNRPARHNALVPALLAQLAEAFGEIEARQDVEVVVLGAAGKSFSTGGDLHAFLEQREDIGSYAEELVGKLNEAIVSIIECDVPVVAAVDGQVTGGALGLVLACDIVIVTDRASFTPYYTEVGFSPDGGWTALLPEIIGRSRASAVQVLNDSISARQALEWGMAYRITQPERLDETVAALCAGIIEKKRGSIRSTKHLLRSIDYRARLEEERRAFLRQITTREASEGIEAFVARLKR